MSKPKIPLPTEHQEQCAVIQWFASYAPTKGLDERLLFAIPNAAKRSYQLAAMMKGAGMRSGVPDLMLAVSKKRRIWFRAQWYSEHEFSGLFIEMKRLGAKGRPEQIEFADLLRRQGYSVVIAQGCDEAIRAIRGYIET